MNETIEYYNQNAVRFAEQTKDADMQPCRERFLRFLLPGASVLDAGCGSGRDALFFREAGFSADAFDASPEICRIASENLGFPVACRRFEEITGEAEYDGIWACASLLHVAAADLPDVLQRLQRLLKPEGVLYASFKEGSAERVKDGRYFHDLTEEACRAVFTDAGFQILETFKSADVREGRGSETWVNVIVRKPAAPKKTVRVAAAVIRDGERIFATQRGYGDWKDYWEFPGGKIEPGESAEEAVHREILEELDTEIDVLEQLDTVEYDYPAFHLSMVCFLAKVRAGHLVLKEHEAARWLTKEELHSVQWLPADQEVIERLFIG